MHPYFNVVQHETLCKHNNVFKFTYWMQIEAARASEKKQYEEKVAELEARMGAVRGDYERTIGQLRVELQKEFDKVARQQKDIDDLCKVSCIYNNTSKFISSHETLKSQH